MQGLDKIMLQTLSDMIKTHADDALAIGAKDSDWMSYKSLRDLSYDVGRTLHNLGLGRGDRIVIVLPNGPEMASAFITLAQWVTTAPLNPNYKKEDYQFYIRNLDAKAVILLEGYKGPALDAAKAHNTAIIWLHPNREYAGAFSLNCDTKFSAAWDTRPPDAEDIALILHTSGTTSRPKMVPLLQRNLIASANHIATSLALSPKDRCLNIMPLFHIHGLLAAVTASLYASAQIVCTDGFDALKFFGLMAKHKPTWYTAVPTMHQAILSRATRNQDIVDNIDLRFLRSSSASLPPQVFISLVKTFNAPVIESYGMTEAAHQMTSNPLPPLPQKPGSVGIPAGPMIKIADELDNNLIQGLGEIVISGSNVTPGYLGDPAANEQNFFKANGVRWFRTGDQGQIDEEGYLWLTGRLKEIINRGGEKISPREIDEILLDHPAISQAVTFALPHDKLGEEVAAAVVLSEGGDADEKALKEFAKERLANFKIPRKIFIVNEIPKGATGKLQRIGLHKKLGLGS